MACAWYVPPNRRASPSRTSLNHLVQISIPSTDVSPISPASTPVDLGAEGEELEGQIANDQSRSVSSKGKEEDTRLPLADKVDELAGLLVGFAFALQ